MTRPRVPEPAQDTVFTRTNMAMNAVRFAAAGLVVVSHARPLFIVDYSQSHRTDPLTQLLYASTSLGHQAVVIFFVLSGYWVGGSVLRGIASGRFSLTQYGVSRLTRLWMVLIPSILLTQLLDRVGTSVWPSSDIYAGSSAYHSVLPDTGAVSHLSGTDTLGNALFLQGLFVPSLGTNTPLWSLAAEFWYYLLFPGLLLTFTRGISMRVRATSAAVVIAAVVALSLPTQAQATPFLLLFPAWLLGAGVARFREPIARHLGVSRWTVPAQLVAACAVVVVAVIDSRTSTTAVTYLLALATAVMLATLIVDVRSRHFRRWLRPWSWAAEWSYSLYAIHLPALAFLAAATVPFARDRSQMNLATYGLVLASAAVPVLLAISMWFIFERHTNQTRDRLMATLNGERRKSVRAGGRTAR